MKADLLSKLSFYSNFENIKLYCKLRFVKRLQIYNVKQWIVFSSILNNEMNILNKKLEKWNRKSFSFKIFHLNVMVISRYDSYRHEIIRLQFQTSNESFNVKPVVSNHLIASGRM